MILLGVGISIAVVTMIGLLVARRVGGDSTNSSSAVATWPCRWWARP